MHEDGEKEKTFINDVSPLFYLIVFVCIKLVITDKDCDEPVQPHQRKNITFNCYYYNWKNTVRK